MSNIHELIDQAVKSTDFTQEDKAGSFERELPEAGMGVCRLREYIELGVQPTASKAYPDKKPARKARFVFELTTPKHVREIEKDDKTTLKIPHSISIECVISKSEKSNFIKLFRQLNWDGNITHPAQALGAPFLCEIVHAWKAGDDKAKDKPSYANLQKDGLYTLSPARKVDPLAGTIEELKVPELLNQVKLFLWDTPTKDTWDSLFIDGTYTDKDDKEVSKNWLQERIMEALDFETSDLATLIAGVDDLKVDEPPKAEDKKEPAEKEDDVVDPLASLGL